MNLQVLNKTEDSLVDGTEVVIHNVFDAKRTVVNAKKEAIKVKGELMGKVAEATTASLEAAASKISSALAAASKAVSDVAAEINSGNSNAALKGGTGARVTCLSFCGKDFVLYRETKQICNFSGYFLLRSVKTKTQES